MVSLISADVAKWPPLFPYFLMAMIPIDCKVTNFSLHLFSYLATTY